jgi:hypothetical protein
MRFKLRISDEGLTFNFSLRSSFDETVIRPEGETIGRQILGNLFRSNLPSVPQMCTDVPPRIA